MPDAQILAQVDNRLENLAAEVDSAFEDLQIRKLNPAFFVHRGKDQASVGLNAVLVKGRPEGKETRG